MSTTNKLLEAVRSNPANVRFDDLCKICEKFFGKPRKASGSHVIYKTPWKGDPRINIQNKKGKAKTYQVRTVIEAIDKLEALNDGNSSED